MKFTAVYASSPTTQRMSGHHCHAPCISQRALPSLGQVPSTPSDNGQAVLLEPHFDEPGTTAMKVFRRRKDEDFIENDGYSLAEYLT